MMMMMMTILLITYDYDYDNKYYSYSSDDGNGFSWTMITHLPAEGWWITHGPRPKSLAEAIEERAKDKEWHGSQGFRIRLEVKDKARISSLVKLRSLRQRGDVYKQFKSN